MLIFKYFLQVCSAAVGLTGDICRALSIKVLPYCDDIMTMLMENLTVSKKICTFNNFST